MSGQEAGAPANAVVPAEPRQADGTIWSRLLAGLPQRIRKQSGSSLLQSALNLAEQLVVESGEAQAVRLAENLADLLRQLDDAQLLGFFAGLVERFGADEVALLAAARAYADGPDEQRAAALYAAAEPRRQELVRRLNMAAGGTALIVKLREKILRMKKAHPSLAPLEIDFHQLLASWFNRGFLRLERIGWDSPAALLESVIRYEAVHEIRDWASLRTRLQGNRRCLGFFHPAMPGVPLIFVEVALTTEMSAAIDPLLTEAGSEAPLARPTNAVFYSINNCHFGLKGINLGDLLIKQVVQDLRTEFPSLRHFATLSPIPGFARWLAEMRKIPGVVPAPVAETLAADGWQNDPTKAEAIRPQLVALCAQYLTGRSAEGAADRVTDPVARFHLTNGARLERINWLADVSPKGLAESHGLMVNYRYLPNSIEANHRAFVDEERVGTSSSVAQLLWNGGSRHTRLLFKEIGFGGHIASGGSTAASDRR